MADELDAQPWIVDEVMPSSTKASTAEWLEAQRRLNRINDPLARKILALHRQCGSGVGACDPLRDELVPEPRTSGWGCETIETIALHFHVDYPWPT